MLIFKNQPVGADPSRSIRIRQNTGLLPVISVLTETLLANPAFRTGSSEAFLMVFSPIGEPRLSGRGAPQSLIKCNKNCMKLICAIFIDKHLQMGYVAVICAIFKRAKEENDEKST